MTKILSASNAQILNTVRANSGLDYQSRVPAVTDGDISKALTELDRYTPMWNLFCENLLNQVALRVFNVSNFENKLKPMKSGSFGFGGMVEELGANLIGATAFDPNASAEDVFSTSKADVQVNYHRINRRDQYKLSVSEEMISEACRTEGGLSDLVNYLNRLPIQSSEWDEYTYMLELLGKAYDEGMANVKVPNLLTSADAEADGKKLIEAVRVWYLKSKFYRNDLNPAGLDSVSQNMTLLMTPEVASSTAVNVLAAAFNMSEAEFMSDRTIIVDKFPAQMGACQAVLLDSDWYKVYDSRITSRSVYNPSSLTFNTFYHVWQVLSYSRMKNALMFSTADTNIGAITTKTVASVTAATASGDLDVLAPGADIQLAGSVTYSDGTASDKVYWIITTETPDTTLGDNMASVGAIMPDTGTYVDRDNVLHIADNATYAELYVTCVSTEAPGKNKTIELTASEA